ncbi:CHASE domain-containing protein [Methylomonas sp. LL1]|nr:CHASE domain-containing protein [Methylomonas sp. LL1]
MLFITLAATVASWHSAQRDLQRETRTYFDFRVRQLLENMQERLAAYQQMLYGTRGLFDASDTVSRGEFRDYVAALRLERHYPGIQGVGFSLLIPAADKAKHLATIHKQGFADYNLHPDGEREIYTSIIYLEPFEGSNLRAFGYDMFTEPVRNRAMAYARDYNGIGMSGKVTLVQESDRDVQAGFLLYLPVYKTGLPHDSEQQRRENLLGWVYSPFRINDFIAGVGGERSGDLALAIYDGDGIGEQSLMYGQPVSEPESQWLNTIQRLDIGGHGWTLVVRAGSDFQSRLPHDKPRLVAGIGLLMSLLLTVLTWQLVNGRGRALLLARQMTEELRDSESRFRLMADSAPVLIWVSGTDKLCFWFNKVWLDFTGRTLDQEFGNGWAEGVHPDDLQHCLDIYIGHFDNRQPFSMEYRLKRHDGEYRWLLDNGIPRFDHEGHFAGYIGSCIDITERKFMQSALEARNADLTRFAEVSAHHLMEPTRRFASYTQRLKKRLSAYPDAAGDEEVLIDLSTLEGDALLLRSLILDIQRYLSAAEPRGEVRLLDSRAIMAEISRKMAAKLQALGATLTVEELPPVMLDRPRLADLFSLILDNTLRHGVPAESRNPLHIILGGQREGHVSRFFISDNGPGIPAKYQTRVFEIFERLGPRTADSGTGIGLAIARRIVESRHGRIGFKHLPRGGTCVVFELPDGEQRDT